MKIVFCQRISNCRHAKLLVCCDKTPTILDFEWHGGECLLGEDQRSLSVGQGAVWVVCELAFWAYSIVLSCALSTVDVGVWRLLFVLQLWSLRAILCSICDQKLFFCSKVLAKKLKIHCGYVYWPPVFWQGCQQRLFGCQYFSQGLSSTSQSQPKECTSCSKPSETSFFILLVYIPVRSQTGHCPLFLEIRHVRLGTAL